MKRRAFVTIDAGETVADSNRRGGTRTASTSVLQEHHPELLRSRLPLRMILKNRGGIAEKTLQKQVRTSPF